MRAFTTGIIAILSIIGLSACQPSDKSIYKEGVHYEILKKHEPSNTPQIVKFVSFTCPACRGFEELMHGYLPDEGVVMERIPVTFNYSQWRAIAKAYATLRQLNLHDELAPALFTSIQEDKTYIGDAPSFLAWLKSVHSGFDRKLASQVYLHPQTNQLVDAYLASEVKYDITGIPTVIVNGNIKLKFDKLGDGTELEQRQRIEQLIDYALALPAS